MLHGGGRGKGVLPLSLSSILHDRFVKVLRFFTRRLVHRVAYRPLHVPRRWSSSDVRCIFVCKKEHILRRRTTSFGRLPTTSAATEHKRRIYPELLTAARIPHNT